MGNAASTAHSSAPPPLLQPHPQHRSVIPPPTSTSSSSAATNGGHKSHNIPHLPAGTSATAADPPPSQKRMKTACACAHLHPNKTCLSYLVSSFGRSFYLAYGIRAGISLALHIIKLLRSKQPGRIFNLDELVSAKGLPIDAVRMGLFIGGFTGAYNGIRCFLARWLGRDDQYTVLGAGAVAGLSILFHPVDSHRTLALYVLARVVQCWYNKQKLEGKWHFWGSDWKHGDALLFSICTAQVMYSYAIRPSTLPPAYFKFIVDTGPIPLTVLNNVKANNRGLPIDMAAVKGVYEKLAPKGSEPIETILGRLATNAYGAKGSALYPPIMPCAILHPHNPNCSDQWVETFVNGAKRTMPLYLSLTFVPMFVLRFWQFVKHPVSSIIKGLISVTKSTGFISSFVSLYMFLICMHRRVAIQDHRSVYWIAGFIAAWTILLEQKSRRSELALYCLPRSLDSLFQTMQDRKLLADVPHGEKMLFCVGMSALMYYREFHPESMSPLLRRLLNFFVPTYRSMPEEHHHGQQQQSNNASGTSTTAPIVNFPALERAALSPSAISASPVSSNDALLMRADSDGLSQASINGVIPLPQPGLSWSREQSFSYVSSSPKAETLSNGHRSTPHVDSSADLLLPPAAAANGGTSHAKRDSFVVDKVEAIEKKLQGITANSNHK